MKMRKIASRGLLSLLCLGVLLPGAFAQYRAGIQGVVLDAQGDAIAGATVTLTNLETNKTSQVSSDDAGVYNFLSLPPGHYRIAVEKAGFKKKTLENVEVAGERTQGANITLEVGDVTQSVTVNGDTVPALETENGNISGTLNSTAVQNLPSLSRDPFQLLRLAPGVFGDGAHGVGGGSQDLPGSQGPGGTSATNSIFQTENQVQINANGQRNTANSFQVDGVSVNSLDWGGAAVITPNEESVKEIRVTANSYDAQYGRTSGAQVEVVSQNGTNDIHGSLFIKIDRPGLNAFQRDFGQGIGAVNRVSNRFNQIGGSVGGPIIKNRLFAFFSYETIRASSVALNNTWAETPQFLTQGASGSIASTLLSFPGEGTAITHIIPEPCSQAGFTQGVDCNAIGSNGSQGLDIGSPIKGSLGTADSTFGQPLTPFGVGGGLDGIPDIAFVQTSNPTKNTEVQYNGRVDFQATHKDLIAFSAYYVPNDSDFFNGNTRPANFWHSDRLNESATVLWDHTFAPTLLNEARLNVSRWYFNELQTNPQEPFGLPQDVINNNLGNNIGGFTFIFGANGPGIFYKTSYNFHDGVTKVFGRHTLKLGFDMYRDQNTDVSAGGALPQYFFQNLWDLANDAPNQENATFNPLTGALTQARHYIRTNTYAGYVQDDFKVHPNLTLNLGLRYEYFGPIYEKHGNLDVAELGPSSAPLTGAFVRVGGNLYNASHNNWGPQIGFAWSPGSLPLTHKQMSNRLVIRGGFGIGYSRAEEAIFLNGRSNPPLVAGFNLFGSNILYAPSSSPTNFNGYPINPATILTFNSANLPASGAPVSLVAFDHNLPTPVTYRDSLGIQYDLGHNWIFSVGYQGSLSRHYTRNQNLNLVFFQDLNPQIQNFQRFTNDSNGSYNALLVELHHKFSSTFELDGQYMYAKAQDNQSGDFSGDFTPGEDPFDRKAEFAPSDYDVRHTMKIYGIWTPRIFRGSNSWMEKIAGGWTVTGIITAHTGFPFTPFYNVQVQGVPGGNTCSLVYVNSNFCTVRPAAFLGGAGSDMSNAGFETGSNNFKGDATAFFAPPDLTAGGIPPAPGVARNSFRGPRYSQVDATLGKAFGLPRMRVLGENAKFDFRANFYNLFNQLNLVPLGAQQIGNIQVNQVTHTQSVSGGNTAFAIANSALAGRIIEAQVRFSF
jgi:Carboxypeptidase regulatory-like domain/TonB dependent receptor